MSTAALLAPSLVRPPCLLLPTNLRVCLELHKPGPDLARMGPLVRRCFLTTALPGTIQVVIVVIMARFAAGI